MPKSEKPVLSFRVSKETYAAVKKAAAEERRPVANWLEIAIDHIVKEKNTVPER